MSARISIRSLRYFLALADELNFSVAATRLNVAQSALSQQIKQLEENLGFELFQRRRPLVLTEPGQFFQLEAKALLERLEQSVADARAIGNRRRQWLGIGFSRSSMYNFLPPVLRAFMYEQPDVELRLFELASDYQSEALRRGEIHIGVARDVPPTAGIRIEKILMEPLVLALPRENQHSKAPAPVNLADLAHERFIVFPKNRLSLYRRRLLATCQSVGFVPDIAQETEEIQTALGLVAAGFGVAIVTRDVATYGHVNLTFKDLTVAGEEFQTSTSALTRDADPSGIEERFLKLLRLRGAGLL